MSPKHQENKRIHDSTTEFFLKVVQREKDAQSKENTTKENLNITKTKTIDTVGRFYNYINQTLDKILSSKISIMILSFALATVLFYSISGKDILTSPTSGTTLDNVPVVVEGLDDSLELSGVPSSVTVGLIGPSIDIYKTNFIKDYEVYLDVTDYEKGEYTVNLKSRNFPDSLTVMLVPNTLKIKLSPKITSTFDLGYQFTNEDELDSKYSVSVDSVAVDSVDVSASKETLQKIAKVVACIDVSKKTEAFEQDSKIKAYDSSGNELSVDLNPTTVHVKCNVASYSKTVPIEANFTGTLPTGYQMSDYTLSENEVTIYGEEDRIKDINSVKLDIDLSELKGSTTINDVALKKINGINKFSIDKVNISIEVEKVITKKIDNISIKVLNNTENYKVSFAGESGKASVSVTGTEEKIASLTADNIQASVDIDGLDVGTNEVNVKVASDDEKIKVELLSSSKVTINIERK